MEKNLSFEYAKVTLPEKPSDVSAEDAILAKGTADGMAYCLRLDGEENVLMEFGPMELGIEYRFRAHILMQELEKRKLPIIDMTPGIRSLQVHFDLARTDAKAMADAIVDANAHLAHLDDITVSADAARGTALSGDDAPRCAVVPEQPRVYPPHQWPRFSR